MTVSSNAVKSSFLLLISNFPTIFFGLLLALFISTVSCGILAPVMLMGYYRVLHKLAKREKATVGDIFLFAFKDFGHNWLVGAVYCLYFCFCTWVSSKIEIVGALLLWFMLLYLPTAVDQEQPGRGISDIVITSILLLREDITGLIITFVTINACEWISVGLLTWLIQGTEVTLLYKLAGITMICLLLLFFESWRNCAASTVYRHNTHFGEDLED